MLKAQHADRLVRLRQKNQAGSCNVFTLKLGPVLDLEYFNVVFQNGSVDLITGHGHKEFKCRRSLGAGTNGFDQFAAGNIDRRLIVIRTTR